MTRKYIYLASPYTHEDTNVMQRRYEDVLAITASYLRQGHFIYSPIVHCHNMQVAFDLPCDWQYWAAYDEAMIGGAEALWVLQLDGWQESVGVKAEIEIAKRLQIPVRYLEVDGREPSAELARRFVMGRDAK